MNKREMIQTIIDRLFEVDETTEKGVHFDVDLSGHVYFHMTATKNLSSGYIEGIKHAWLCHPWDIQEQFEKAICDIARLAALPPQQPKVRIELDESKARELGLIA